MRTIEELVPRYKRTNLYCNCHGRLWRSNALVERGYPRRDPEGAGKMSSRLVHAEEERLYELVAAALT